MPNQNRQLVAILFTDIVGYTSLMQQSEQKAVALIKHYNTTLNYTVGIHHGQVLNYYGDGSLCSFSSVTEALHCAIELQKELQYEPIVPLRIGMHIGEIFFEEGKALGDGVNIASRIQSLGQANTILFSREIFVKIRNQPEFKSTSLGLFEFKNLDEPMEVFALANEGMVVPKKEEMSGKLKEIQNRSAYKKRIVIAALIIVLGIAAFFTINNFKNKKGFTGQDRSVVVLPFENYTNDSNQENLINSITEEITTQLAKIADIKVIGRTSAVLYKNSKKPLNEIADALGVSTYLEGSVSKEGDKIRITAQLINAHSQEHIWADSYVRELSNVFTMQSEVALQIAEQLHVKLTEQEKSSINKKPTNNNDAYKFYKIGRLFWDQRTKAGLDSAEANYNRAIELDPDYALAYSGLADCYIYNQKGLLQTEAMPIAKDYAQKALSLDSTSGEALTTLGFIQSAFDYDWVKSKATLEKAIRLNPNYPTAHLFYGNLLQYTGENTDDGIREIKKALSLDPLSVNLNYVLGRNYYYAHKYDSAYEQLKKTYALNANFNLAKGNLAYVLLEKKNYSEAFELINQLKDSGISKVDYYKGLTLSYAYAISNDKIRAKTELENSLAKYPDQSPFNAARVYIALNDYDQAINNLEKAYNERELWMYSIKADPTFDPLRNEPRFIALMKKMNLE